MYPVLYFVACGSELCPLALSTELAGESLCLAAFWHKNHVCKVCVQQQFQSSLMFEKTSAESSLNMHVVFSLLLQNHFFCVVSTVHLNMNVSTCSRLWRRLCSVFVMAQEAPKMKRCQHHALLLHTNPLKFCNLRLASMSSFSVAEVDQGAERVFSRK